MIHNCLSLRNTDLTVELHEDYTLLSSLLFIPTKFSVVVESDVDNVLSIDLLLPYHCSSGHMKSSCHDDVASINNLFFSAAIIFADISSRCNIFEFF
jgi:hypothetical protein